MKKIIALLVVLSLLGTLPALADNSRVTVSSECDISDLEIPLDTAVTAAKVGQSLDIKAKSVILMEPNTGQILYESNSDEVMPPASITKIMSLLLVMEAMERSDFTAETMVTASEHACSMGGSQIWLEPGEGMSVDDLLKATVIASANDATVALGEKIAGSEEGFVAQMNERAAELGMKNTVFKNCSGLDADGHVTTAHDVAIMSSALIKYPLIKKYSTVWMDTLRDGKSELVNTNKLVRFYEGTTGLKTGTTSGAGYCLSATAMRDGLELVAVVMGGDSSNDRFAGAKKLLDYGFSNYKFSKLSAEIEDNMKVPVKKGTMPQIEIEAGQPLDVLLEKSQSGEITRELVLNKDITAPVKQGDILGNVNIYIGDEQLGVIPLTAKNDLERLSLFVTLKWILGGLFTL